MDLCKICHDSTQLNDVNQEVAANAVKCAICANNFYLTCAGITTAFYRYYIQQLNKEWKCYACSTENTNDTTVNAKSISNIEALAGQMTKQVQSLTSELTKMNQQQFSWQQQLETRLPDIIDHHIEKRLHSIQPPNNTFQSRHATVVTNSLCFYRQLL